MHQIDNKNVELFSGFWKTKYELNRKTTIFAVMNRFEETGRFAAFSCNWKEGDENKPHFFWDSDVAKWIEGVSYLFEKEVDKILQDKVEAVIDEIIKNQDESGYFNIYFTVVEPNQRFVRRADHELYCAGHLIEAAVAYFKATGRGRFLDAMKRYVDCIYKVFIIEESAGFVTPGHEEIELALISLYRLTREKKHLDMVKYFIDKRGNNERDAAGFYDFALSSYDQSHSPVREQDSAMGHAVRACYLYCAMADLAFESGDKNLLTACQRIFYNIVNAKMYITGGIGSTDQGEAFTADYDLPNSISYTETCAAISLLMFAQRMFLIEKDSLYTDIVERCFYNGILSGLSLDGEKFFYINSMEIDPIYRRRHTSIKRGREFFPITTRVSSFWCSCCPPNINRTLASLGSLIFCRDEDTYFINQYTDCSMSDGNANIIIKTDYPVCGEVRISCLGVKKLSLRIPGWCKEFDIDAPYIILNGYAYIENPDIVELSFKMKPTLYRANNAVQADSGRVALMCGPIVYCLEGVDNGKFLRCIYLKLNECDFRIEYDEVYNLNVIHAIGYRPQEIETLYAPFTGEAKRINLKFIPYNAFANRNESEMIVFVGVES